MADEPVIQNVDVNGNRGIKLFGFEIRRAKADKEAKEKLPSVVPPVDEDGAGYVTAAGAHFGSYVNIGDGNESKDNFALVRQYRSVAMHPEVDEAIENVVNEAVTASEEESSVNLVMDEVKMGEPVKKKIQAEFDDIVRMLKFNELGHDIFRRWYVDGRMYHHLVLEKGKESQGIVDIRPVDAAKIRKVKELKTKKDPETGAKIIESVNEYFIYQEKPGMNNTGIKLTQDSVSYVTSGLLDADRKKVVSYLHKGLKAINQLRMMEDSLVIYRLARAPERRIFYIDVGSLPRGKAEQYMKDIMSRYRNKIVYDADTGNLKDDRKHMSMLEDFWLPRREGGRGTEISTLPGGDNLGQIDDIVYFQKKLYKSLNVPISRLDAEANPFSMGRSNEISRDELKFQKFIDRLRMRFSSLFLGILKRQLLLKNIITEEDWEDLENNIVVNYIRDNHFTELKDSELLRERLQSLEAVQDYVGVYYSKEWIKRNILRQKEDEIVEMQKQMDKESMEAPEDTPEYQQGHADATAEAEAAAAAAPPPPPPASNSKPAPVTINVTGAATDDKSKDKKKKAVKEEYEDEVAAIEIDLMNEVKNYLTKD